MKIEVRNVPTKSRKRFREAFKKVFGSGARISFCQGEGSIIAVVFIGPPLALNIRNSLEDRAGIALARSGHRGFHTAKYNQMGGADSV